MKNFIDGIILAAALVLITSLSAHAGEKTSANPFLGILSTATPAEMPAKAAGLVAQADAKNLQQTTVDVVKAAVGLNPAAAALIVGAIAKSSPEAAATAAATAISLLPSQAVAIARAAAAAAPKQAGKIVEAICRVLPSAYQKVADAVASVVPEATKEILAGIANAIPSLASSINTVLASYKDSGAGPTLDEALFQVAHSSPQTITLASAFMSPSMITQPPGTPIVVLITNVLEVTNGITVTNAHSYSAPN